MPESPERASAPSLDELRARVRLRVVRRRAHEPAVELARPDRPIEHLRPDHARRRARPRPSRRCRARTARPCPAPSGACRARRRSAAPDRRALELARAPAETPARSCRRAPRPSARGYLPADVVGLEDGGVRWHLPYGTRKIPTSPGFSPQTVYTLRPSRLIVPATAVVRPRRGGAAQDAPSDEARPSSGQLVQPPAAGIPPEDAHRVDLLRHRVEVPPVRAHDRVEDAVEQWPAAPPRLPDCLTQLARPAGCVSPLVAPARRHTARLSPSNAAR